MLVYCLAWLCGICCSQHGGPRMWDWGDWYMWSGAGGPFCGQGCRRLGEEDSVLDLSWMDRDIFCTTEKVNRSCSFHSCHLQQQQSRFSLTSHITELLLHLLFAKRKGNKYLLFRSLDAGFIPLAILSLLLLQLMMWLWHVPSTGKT